MNSVVQVTRYPPFPQGAYWHYLWTVVIADTGTVLHCLIKAWFSVYHGSATLPGKWSYRLVFSDNGLLWKFYLCTWEPSPRGPIRTCTKFHCSAVRRFNDTLIWVAQLTLKSICISVCVYGRKATVERGPLCVVWWWILQFPHYFRTLSLTLCLVAAA